MKKVIGKKTVATALSMALALSGAGSVLAESPELASGEKYTQAMTEDGWIKVTNDGGPVLGYSAESGVTILEDDGFAFKDLNRNGTLDAYEDWRLDVETRAKDLASQMSIEQMAAMMLLRVDFSATTGEPSEEILGLMDRGLRTVALFVTSDVKTQVKYVNALQTHAETNDFGIPVELQVEWDLTSPASKWPSNIALGATFDPELIKEKMMYCSEEWRALGFTSMNGPQIDLVTEPRWRRITEELGEDPALVGDLTEAFVNGLQSTYDEEGNDLGWGEDSVNAIMKHFPGDGNGESGREAHSFYGKYAVYPGDNLYTLMLPFQRGMNLSGKTGSAAGVMPSYSIGINEDGSALGDEKVGSAYSQYKIEELLRGELEFDGLALSDYSIIDDRAWGMQDLSQAEQYCALLEAGMDKICESPYVDELLAGIDLYADEYGEEAARERMETSAVRIVKLMMQIGLFENAYLETEKSMTLVNSPEKAEAGYEAQLKSIVMLKNADNTIHEAAADEEKPTVYIPMTYTPASMGMSGSTPASWGLPLDIKVVDEYFNVVTDKLSDTLTGEADENGKATVSENDIIRASAEEVAACDFALVIIQSPQNVGNGYDSENEKYIPISLQYGPYTANSAYVRQNSISGDDVTVTQDVTYGAQSFVTNENRSYFGESAVISNAGDLDIVLDVAANAKKTIVAVKASNAMCFHEFENEVDAICMYWSNVSDNALLDVITGKYEPSGLLPMQMPTNMETVEAQLEDVPRDMECYTDSQGNTYDFAFGLNWSGVINDERVATYSVEPLEG